MLSVYWHAVTYRPYVVKHMLPCPPEGKMFCRHPVTSSMFTAVGILHNYRSWYDWWRILIQELILFIQSLYQFHQAVPVLHECWYTVMSMLRASPCHTKQMNGSVGLCRLWVQQSKWYRSLTKKKKSEPVLSRTETVPAEWYYCLPCLTASILLTVHFWHDNSKYFVLFPAGTIRVIHPTPIALSPFPCPSLCPHPIALCQRP